MDHLATTETIAAQAPPGGKQSAAPPPHQEIAQELQRFVMLLEQWARRHKVRP